jgi:Zn-dependent protease with chaperone function
MRAAPSIQGSIDDIASSITGPWTPIPRAMGYRLGMVLVALLMICIPLIYLAIVGAVGWGVWWHLSHNTPMLTATHNPRGTILMFVLYLMPAAVGLGIVIVMFKPLLMLGGGRAGTFSLEPAEEPRLHAFVDMVCSLIGAPPPKRIDVDCDVNASASFRAGMLSLFLPGDLVLTIGMPLVAGMNTRQFAAILAHEFGHFAQGTAMRSGRTRGRERRRTGGRRGRRRGAGRW